MAPRSGVYLRASQLSAFQSRPEKSSRFGLMQCGNTSLQIIYEFDGALWPLHSINAKCASVIVFQRHSADHKISAFSHFEWQVSLHDNRLHEPMLTNSIARAMGSSLPKRTGTKWDSCIIVTSDTAGTRLLRERCPLLKALTALVDMELRTHRTEQALWLPLLPTILVL